MVGCREFVDDMCVVPNVDSDRSWILLEVVCSGAEVAISVGG